MAYAGEASPACPVCTHRCVLTAHCFISVLSDAVLVQLLFTLVWVASRVSFPAPSLGSPVHSSWKAPSTMQACLMPPSFKMLPGFLGERPGSRSSPLEAGVSPQPCLLAPALWRVSPQRRSLHLLSHRSPLTWQLLVRIPLLSTCHSSRSPCCPHIHLRVLLVPLLWVPRAAVPDPWGPSGDGLAPLHQLPCVCPTPGLLLRVSSSAGQQLIAFFGGGC